MASSFETGSVSQLFATPIWTFKPRNAAALATQLEAKLRSLRDADPRWKKDSRGLWQSRDDLHEHPDLQGLVALIHEASAAVLKLLEMQCQLRITGLWGNIGRHTDFLHEHTHPNNFLSGVVYVKVPPNSGATSFKDPRPQTRVLRPRVLRDNPFNSSEFQYVGAPGTVVMFHSWLEHSVTPNETDEDRITVAFNLMVTGPLGSRELLAYSEI
jgi:uncharacterized protein (TIGR02466 family)